MVPQTLAGAQFTRDTMATVLYSRLFDWLVGRINTVLGYADQQNPLHLGILDIYGMNLTFLCLFISTLNFVFYNFFYRKQYNSIQSLLFFILLLIYD